MAGVVVDVCHGTAADFQGFDAGRMRAGLHFGSLEQARMRCGRAGLVIHANLNLQRTRRCRDAAGNWAAKVRSAKAAGFDSIVYLNRYEGLPTAAILRLQERGLLGHLDTLSEADFRKAVPEAQDSFIAFYVDQVRTRSIAQQLAPKQPAFAPPPTRNHFQTRYAQHIDIRGRATGAALANRDAILANGFRKGANVNALPPSTGGQPGNVIERNFAPRQGDVIYLAPESAWRGQPNGMEIQDGWRPEPWEVIVVADEDVGRPTYELFMQAWRAHHGLSEALPPQEFDGSGSAAAVGDQDDAVDADGEGQGAAPRPVCRGG